jgi:inorganic pyrophosphatase
MCCRPTFPGCVIEVRVIALLRTRNRRGMDDKLVCVPRHDPHWQHVEGPTDLPGPLRDQITHTSSRFTGHPKGTSSRSKAGTDPRLRSRPRYTDTARA